MDFNVNSIFFEALEYPEFVRPFFFIKKQQESGWHKGVFLGGLHEIYFEYNKIFKWKFNILKRKNPELKIEDVSVPIETGTGEKQKIVLTKKMLEEQEVAILTAYQIDKPEKNFSDIEIITFAEYALGFIRNEFQIQTGAKEYKWFRPRTKTYFEYFIISEAPFIDFPRFKNAVRNLLWTGSNIDDFKKTLQHFSKAALEIVEIWNNELFKVEQKSLEEEVGLPEKVRVEFNHESLKHSWWNETRLFDVKSPQRFTNQDLADYAVNVANFLGSEIDGKKDESVEAFQKNFIKDFVEGIEKLKKSKTKDFIKDLQVNKLKKNEGGFRDWFDDWFDGRGYNTVPESLIGDGRIDLKVSHKAIGISRIIEFKDWRNSDKNEIMNQLESYLTPFENDGYIFLITNAKQSRIEEYKAIITGENSKNSKAIWEEMPFGLTGFKYYKSEHDLDSGTKTIYHFVFSVR